MVSRAGQHALVIALDVFPHAGIFLPNSQFGNQDPARQGAGPVGPGRKKPKKGFVGLAVVHGAFASSATADCIFAHDMIKIIEVTYNNDALILSFIVNVSLGEDPALILPCHE